jgi:hypothetical protein
MAAMFSLRSICSPPMVDAEQRLDAGEPPGIAISGVAFYWA